MIENHLNLIRKALKEKIKKQSNNRKIFIKFMNSFSGRPYAKEERDNDDHLYYSPSKIVYKQFDEEDFDSRKNIDHYLLRFINKTPYTINYNYYQRKSGFVNDLYFITPYVLLIRILKKNLKFEYYLKNFVKLTRQSNSEFSNRDDLRK